jgi:glutamate dehydrogenase/leucine dehydrogenase
MGYTVVAVSDVYGAVANPAGIDIPALFRHVAETGRVPGFAGASELKTNILETECDILIPAAVQDVITAANADRLRTKLVVEAANAPVSPEADEMLQKKGVSLVPDVVANSGGAIVCDFERTQGLSNDFWPLEKVREKLRDRILTAYDEAVAKSREARVSLRRGAWINALTKIRAAMVWRGWC